MANDTNTSGQTNMLSFCCTIITWASLYDMFLLINKDLAFN